MSAHLIPVGIASRHIYLSKQAMDRLFGPGSTLTVSQPLRQAGEFISRQSVDILVPNGSSLPVHIAGPLGDRVQVNISRTDARHLGIHPPIGRMSALPADESVTLQGPAGSLVLRDNIMIPGRLLYLDAGNAVAIGVKDGDRVFVAPQTGGDDERAAKLCIFGNVLVRVHRSFVPEFRIDTDDGNAAGLSTGDYVYVVQMNTPATAIKTGKRLITEYDVRQAIAMRQKIRVRKGMIITPAARDLAKERNVFMES